jgi:CubicO group peptidase (beta-lactamase class C family)
MNWDCFKANRREAMALIGGGAATLAAPAIAFPTSAIPAVQDDIDAFMKAFDIPGIALAIVRPGAPPLTYAYGLRSLGSPAPLDTDTLFAIASITKGFTAAAIAILVDEGKLGWNEPVVRYMPDFAMADADVTRMMTVLDLLLHRSGLGLGEGDLLQFPHTDFSREQYLVALRHLPLATGFRSEFAYDNMLFVIAGLLIQRVSGLSWEDFITQRLLRPLGMRSSVAAITRVQTSNIAGRHGRLGPPVRGIGNLELVGADESPSSAPAGGIHASAKDIVHWLDVQLARGVLPDGRRLWSKAQSDVMWNPRIIVQSNNEPNADTPVGPITQAVAPGWSVSDFRGHRMLGHGGGLAGQSCSLQLLPGQGIGLALFSNTEDYKVIQRLALALLDRLIGAPPFDWLGTTKVRIERDNREALATLGSKLTQRPPGGPTLPLDRYAGTYRDAWYGDIIVEKRAGGLHINFTHTSVYKSVLQPWGPDTFRTQFGRDIREDALITFVIEEGRAIGMRLKALSPLADFSYDFQDLHPLKVS